MRGVASAGQFVACALIPTKSGEAVRVARVGLDIRYRHPDFIATTTNLNTLQVIGEHHQAIGIGEGQWTQQDSFDDGEDRGGGADAEREHEDGGDGEAERLLQLAEGKLKIKKDFLHALPRWTVQQWQST